MSPDFDSLSKEERIKVECDVISEFKIASGKLNESLLNQISSIHRNKKGDTYAPHKPVLLLSIIELVEENVISNNIIELNDVLKERFKAVWETNIPPACCFNCDIKAPFTYLDHEDFWTLRNKKEALIDNNMLEAFKNKEMASRIKEILLHMLQQESVATSKPSKITKLRNQVILLVPFTSSIITMYA